MHKLRRIGRCLKVLNKQSETGQYESEEGVAKHLYFNAVKSSEAGDKGQLAKASSDAT